MMYINAKSGGEPKMAEVSLISRTAGLTNTNEKIADRLAAKAPWGRCCSTVLRATG